eukprot:TRINITY_DN4120_c0_g2_i1.p1 TRINITY_DN4120_c0_g2~~TRINITY_DN4120_c0_g2_i1.p1  ORF type:complete len:291 (-),score=68.41 TRINITY_DN4120_c0_g2_i1:209-1081(-)
MADRRNRRCGFGNGCTNEKCEMVHPIGFVRKKKQIAEENCVFGLDCGRLDCIRKHPEGFICKEKPVDKRAIVSCGVLFVRIEKGECQVLLGLENRKTLKNSEYLPLWHPLGGKIDAEEEEKDAAAREVWEETGKQHISKEWVRELLDGKDTIRVSPMKRRYTLFVVGRSDGIPEEYLDQMNSKEVFEIIWVPWLKMLKGEEFASQVKETKIPLSDLSEDIIRTDQAREAVMKLTQLIVEREKVEWKEDPKEFQEMEKLLKQTRSPKKCNHVLKGLPCYNGINCMFTHPDG